MKTLTGEKLGNDLNYILYIYYIYYYINIYSYYYILYIVFIIIFSFPTFPNNGKRVIRCDCKHEVVYYKKFNKFSLSNAAIRNCNYQKLVRTNSNFNISHVCVTNITMLQECYKKSVNP